MSEHFTNTDQELAQQIADGDVVAFRRFFDKYRNKVFTIAWKFTNTEAIAQDLVQEIFIKIWVNKEKLSRVSNLNSYLNAVVRNHVFNHLRKESLEQKMLVKLSVSKIEPNKEIYDAVCFKELQNMVHHAISQLPPQQKKVYEFSRQQGLKHEEIAERMGISRSTVKGHMVEALSYIRKYLTANGEVIGTLILLILYQCNLL